PSYLSVDSTAVRRRAADVLLGFLPMSLDTSTLDAERSRLVMIQPHPFNAEAPPEALHGEITPLGLHYVRSNFALPDHDRILQVGGAVGRPLRLTLDDLRAMTPVT